jgi:hypothetical protein
LSWRRTLVVTTNQEGDIVSTLTIILETVLAVVGLAVAVGSPLVGMRLHQRDHARAQLPLVAASSDAAADRHGLAHEYASAA